jgi:hypothetical protein
MMKALYAVAISAAIVTSWSALAETTVSTTSRSCKNSAYGPAVCTEVTTNSTGGSGGAEPARARDIDPVEERLSREQKEARIRKWEEFCKPVSFIDEMGITRLRYAHAGCDLGRTGEGSLAQMQ